MGSWNSNRWTAYRRRGVADECLAFSVTMLRRLKLTDQTQYAGTYTWTLSEGKCELHFNINQNYEGGLRLYFEHLNVNAVIVIAQSIDMHMTVIPRGGRRWWMECPIVKGHAGGFPIQCTKRCAVLYFSAKLKKFGCRECLDLTYRSSQKHDKRIDFYRKNPEAFHQAVLKSYEKIDSADEQMKDLRKDGFFKNIEKMVKGPHTPGSSGGAPSIP